VTLGNFFVMIILMFAVIKRKKWIMYVDGGERRED